MRFFYKLQPFENMRLRIRRVNINRKIRRLGKHLNREVVQLCLNGLLILRGDLNRSLMRLPWISV